ncbi:hypothetical protein [Thermomonospora cellulosilytica]|uniref:DUF4232 domain-containing protein n=1 Tax=Thermomonospora cellulosilytica TaxID=1411118 RepID=A0A7W3R6H3_9ACTN|nr:hypothetical protein [Thermomonospora cellulosilytica]MBA9001469.1 hypothetical protein [Thermomonospora cellulosilytica]
MDLDAHSDEDGPVYWRRRAMVLGGVAAVVALLAWACGGGGEQTVRPAGAADAQTPTIPVLPTVTVTATPSGTPKPRPSAEEEPTTRDGHCDPDDLVLTFRTDQTTYAGGRHPRLQLSLVNIGDRTCTYDTGPENLRVRIMSGPDRIWSSDHCTKGASLQKLRRGVPHIQTITWDRKRSTPGCPKTRPAAKPGTYVATAHLEGLKPHREVFHLR